MAVGLHGDGPSTILVAVDGSDTSMRAGAYAAGLARRQHAKLICLYVRVPSALVGMNIGLAAPLRQTQDEIAREIRDMVSSGMQRIGLEVAFLERAGNPVAEIARAADELQVDAVVVGASTQAGHRFVGSIAAHLVRIARWPVTVVP